MTRRTLAFVSLVALAACRGEPSGPLEPNSPGGPSFVILDGAHPSGNPDFFFLPPMVPNPSGDANFDAGGFNPNLEPGVTICALNAAEESEVPGASCSTEPPPIEFVFGSGANPVEVTTAGQHYRVNWKVPNTTTVFFRITVHVGVEVLGFADIKTGTGGQIKNVDTGELIPLKDGQTLPIMFRIEQFALCDSPLTGGCSSGTVDPATGGTVFYTEGGVTVGGVTIPAQPGGGDPITVTISPCEEENLPVDIPLFGRCLDVLTDPLVEGDNALEVPGEVFVCEIGVPASISAAQKARITLHRQHDGGIEALPHTPGSCPSAISSVDFSLKGLIRAVAHGQWKTAKEQVFVLLAPKPLYARRLDVGAGGLTAEFSQFQNALPAKMEIYSGDGQVALPGAELNPTVIVTDLMGDPVENATVNFSAVNGTAGAAFDVTGPDGLASVTWTLSSPAGPNSLVATGRGIADATNDGPRCGFDPFMSIQPAFPDFAGCDGPPAASFEPVSLRTGSLTFTATDIPVPYGSGGFRYLLTAEGGGPADFATVVFVDAGFSTGPAPFGSGATAGCALLISNPAVTNWPLGSLSLGGGSDLLLRRTFAAPAGSNLRIFVAIDNDARVFLNGVDLTAQNGSAAPASGMSGDGLKKHEGCAVRPTLSTDPFVFSATGDPSGTNILAVRGRDRGTAGYFDVQVKVVP